MTPDFRFYLASRFFSGAGMMMLRAAVAWHVFELSHSAFQLGLLGLVQFIPGFVLTLFGGAVADSYDRRKVMQCAQSVLLVCGATLFAATYSGNVTVPLLYAAVVAGACASAFDSPSRAALLPSLVTREYFPRAVTLN
jgi:MFS family permease